jgi:hypothetical protein
VNLAALYKKFKYLLSFKIKKKRPNQPLGMFIDQEKRFRMSDKLHDSSDFTTDNPDQSYTLYDEDEYYEMGNEFGAIASNLGIKKLDLAPDVDTRFEDEDESGTAELDRQVHASLSKQSQQQQDAVAHFDKRKRYVKEAWPGRESAVSGMAAPSGSNRTSRSPPPPPPDDDDYVAQPPPPPPHRHTTQNPSGPFMPEKPVSGGPTVNSNPTKRLII